MKVWKKLLLIFVLILFPFSAAQAKKTHVHAVPTPAPIPQLIPALPPLLTSYDVYIGGIHLLAAQIWFEEQGSVYHAIVKAKTVGLIGKFFPWNTILDGHGLIEGDQLKPQEFFTRDEWAHKPKITKLHFDGKGGVTPEFDPPNTDKNREIVTDEQKHNALDPITALLQMLAHVAVEKSCAIPVPVFDGKRRFDITGKDAGFEDISDEDYSSYSGKARLCDADFTMISGEWKDREHARFWQKNETEQGREPFHIWLGAVASNLPEIPVKMESGSIGGFVVVHLTSWRYATSDEIKAEVVVQQ